MLEFIAITLALLHFGFPLTYYLYAKTKWLRKPWNIKIDENRKPKVTIIIPTYNEEQIIEMKLNNLYEQDYPKNLIEIIVVDSASTDRTVEKVKEWIKKHPGINLKLLEEPIRRGMNPALNFALKHVSGGTEIIIFTDADSYWHPETLKKIVKYFADPIVGAVTTNIVFAAHENTSAFGIEENIYRNYYNNIRVSESKLHSTPIHNGALVAFRLKLIQKIGGIPEFTGNNDSTPASIVAFMGYRAIQINDVVVEEPLTKNQFHRKIRRAQHLLLSFLKTKQYVKRLGVYTKSSFDTIWRIEWWLNVANPWLLVISVLLLVISFILYRSITALALLGIGIAFLAVKAYRTWILQQIYLIIGALRNLYNKELIWTK